MKTLAKDIPDNKGKMRYAICMRDNGGLEIWKSVGPIEKNRWKFWKALTDWNHLAARLLTLSLGEDTLIKDVPQMERIFKETADRLEKVIKECVNTGEINE